MIMRLSSTISSVHRKFFDTAINDPMCTPRSHVLHQLIISAALAICRYRVVSSAHRTVLPPNNVSEDGRNDWHSLLHWCITAELPLTSHLPRTYRLGRCIVWHIVCTFVSEASLEIPWNLLNLTIGRSPLGFSLGYVFSTFYFFTLLKEYALVQFDHTGLKSTWVLSIQGWNATYNSLICTHHQLNPSLVSFFLAIFTYYVDPYKSCFSNHFLGPNIIY